MTKCLAFCLEAGDDLFGVHEYCDKNQLTARQRLELFINVCRAVQHAHQKGIIHRDIKPGNVLVNVSDGVPIPKMMTLAWRKRSTGH